MKFLAVHPSPLMYSRVFLRLEPLGFELAADTARSFGYEVYPIDLQVESRRNFFRTVEVWRPDVIEFARACPWGCSFCSAWTFYGRSYRVMNSEKAVEDLGQVRKPGGVHRR